MKIATWNINGVKARLENTRTWLKDAQPDIACFQEIKSQTEAFPAEIYEELGYNLAVHGQKGFNGVAILSKRPIDDIVTGLTGDDGDDHARYIEAVISTNDGSVRVGCIYLPNGNPPDGDKYTYKLKWMDRLRTRAQELLEFEEPFVLAGDFNVIPTETDVHDPAAWAGDALFLPETRRRYRALTHLGLTDAFTACNDATHQYTFWDYQAGAWQKNKGIRIDHLLLSPQAVDRLADCGIDRATRGWERPSDHVPVWAEFKF